MVIFGPICQVGCRSAASAVTAALDAQQLASPDGARVSVTATAMVAGSREEEKR